MYTSERQRNQTKSLFSDRFQFGDFQNLNFIKLIWTESWSAMWFRHLVDNLKQILIPDSVFPFWSLEQKFRKDAQCSIYLENRHISLLRLPAFICMTSFSFVSGLKQFNTILQNDNLHWSQTFTATGTASGNHMSYSAGEESLKQYSQSWEGDKMSFICLWRDIFKETSFRRSKTIQVYLNNVFLL